MAHSLAVSQQDHHQPQEAKTPFDVFLEHHDAMLKSQGENASAAGALHKERGGTATAGGGPTQRSAATMSKLTISLEEARGIQSRLNELIPQVTVSLQQLQRDIAAYANEERQHLEDDALQWKEHVTAARAEVFETPVFQPSMELAEALMNRGKASVVAPPPASGASWASEAQRERRTALAHEARRVITYPSHRQCVSHLEAIGAQRNKRTAHFEEIAEQRRTETLGRAYGLYMGDGPNPTRLTDDDVYHTNCGRLASLQQ